MDGGFYVIYKAYFLLLYVLYQRVQRKIVQNALQKYIQQWGML